ncbi:MULTISPECIES: sulfurtransferase TusA family protein [Bacillus]|uniref:sulfurtransferase TusA family protein n=1 Tax=Bacillus TaxID=1386 RepID=UPI001F5AFBB5|nr:MULTISPECIES: sulfurtransferase TusA family protein [Bacillus cereus group]MDA1536709.1 sulfurtransferase TusA family protein [Bacillus cereus group sp. TH254-2LC]MDA1547268.1 sulfurtransferase TusA family protein [Bacillus cereus group sp. TH253LC]MDA1631055.1 sulfurtransferase TusA family protein [Bacillus cereus group sp. TH172LC]MDA1834360.1 sulfurtransferase TusA family protein [Bacillus cereus group sp. BY142LC]MDA1839787.1 sulfurtransferase TusA family protein [Bacillus cereus group 
MNIKQVLDVKGLACPMPIVKTKKAMEALQSGEVLEVHTTDKGAIKDIPAWSQTGGHEVLKHTEEDGELKFWIKKA